MRRENELDHASDDDDDDGDGVHLVWLRMVLYEMLVSVVVVLRRSRAEVAGHEARNVLRVNVASWSLVRRFVRQAMD